MDELFRRASKYSMLEDDIRAATQQVLVAGQAAKSEATRSFRAPNHPGSSNRGQDERRPSFIRTPLTKSYEKLLPIIHDLPGFRWPIPIRLNPSKRNHNKRCDYHKDHGHTTKTCINLHHMVEDLLKAGHLKQYVRTAPKGEGSSYDRGPRAPTAPIRAVINYIYGGPLDDEYSSKRKRQRLLRAATVREHPHRDALILTLGVGDYAVKRILVDPGSSADLLQVAVIKQMDFELSNLENPGRTLSEFNNSSTTSLGDVTLPVQAGPVILNVLFSVVEDLSPFNAILGRMWLHGMKAIPSTYHQMIAREAGTSADREHSPKKQMLLTNSNYSTRRTKIPRQQTRWRLSGYQKDVNASRMLVPSYRQPRDSSSKRQKVIREEMEKLLKAGFIKEVEYPEWLANVVVVPKKGGKWRVCVGYTNLNDACPKDSFPLPRINQIVDATFGHEMLSFLDAFSGYHQIPMAPEDEEKTFFITPHGLYCYRVMSFGLKNTGATYQRLMTKIFKSLIGDIIEVYIDDVLNPAKCAFRVSSGKFLGFMVTQRGIEINPDQLPIGLLARSCSVPCRPENKNPYNSLAKRLPTQRQELSEYGIDYQPRLSLKGQVMADFITELPEERAPDKNRLRMMGGLCMLMGPPARPDQESDSSSKHQPENSWSNPSV
ncbi:Transposon Ty3-I Gag-Pol polyprotein [Vitis vinifera]|uniref:Transposon Ty3-I Gag-Pol polyprotein n=1 Tax=Vitis vinifera TaxID=29760 RepID=A0A438GRW2_VITVI|nr:Transposon Ty3-I Gag-Pol polyprotein [Vitis vinifera]